MYAIVKTGGKQYKVAPGDIIEIEKLDAAAGDKVETDASKAAGTKVVAEVLEQVKGEKQLVFKFKKRKNYKRTKGHRQQLTRVRIEAVGAAKAEKKAAPKKAAAKKDEAAAEKKAAAKKDVAVAEEAPKKAPAKKAAPKKDEAAAEKKPAAKKAPAKKTEAKKAEAKEEKEAE